MRCTYHCGVVWFGVVGLTKTVWFLLGLRQLPYCCDCLGFFTVNEEKYYFRYVRSCSAIYLDMIPQIWPVVCKPSFGQHRAHPKSGRKLSHETYPTSLSCSTNTLMRCLLCCSCRCGVVSQVFFEDGLVSAGCVSCSVTDCCRGMVLASYPRKIRRQHVVPSLTPSWCVGYFV